MDGLKNREHVAKLLGFCREILAVCSDLDLVPVLSGSLAVFAYTRAQGASVNDIDLACSEHQFARLGRALESKGIAHKVREWHVLQAHRGDLKVDFDSIEYWMADLPHDHGTLVVDRTTFTVVSLSNLRELYRRGLEATAGDEVNVAKHQAIASKYEALCSVKKSVGSGRQVE